MIGNCYLTVDAVLCHVRSHLLCYFCRRIVCKEHSNVVNYKYGPEPRKCRGTYMRRACISCQDIHKENIRSTRGASWNSNGDLYCWCGNKKNPIECAKQDHNV